MLSLFAFLEDLEEGQSFSYVLTFPSLTNLIGERERERERA